jgi:dihydrofolate reductase
MAPRFSSRGTSPVPTFPVTRNPVRFLLTVSKPSFYSCGMPRKVILGFGISIDGYIARRNGAMDYLVIDKEGEALMADFFAKIDTTIMGRKTAAATAKMRKSGEIPETPGIANYVVSRRWKPGKREGFEVVSGSLTAFVKKLKRRPGKDIYLGGGGQLCRSFLQEDLVDELFIGVGPVLNPARLRVEVDIVIPRPSRGHRTACRSSAPRIQLYRFQQAG